MDDCPSRASCDLVDEPCTVAQTRPAPGRRGALGRRPPRGDRRQQPSLGRSVGNEPPPELPGVAGQSGRPRATERRSPATGSSSARPASARMRPTSAGSCQNGAATASTNVASSATSRAISIAAPASPAVSNCTISTDAPSVVEASLHDGLERQERRRHEVDVIGDREILEERDPEDHGVVVAAGVRARRRNRDERGERGGDREPDPTGHGRAADSLGTPRPGWRNWQTRGTQNPVGFGP